MSAQPVAVEDPDALFPVPAPRTVKAAERFATRTAAAAAEQRRGTLTEEAKVSRPRAVETGDERWPTLTLDIPTPVWVVVPLEQLRKLYKAYGTIAAVAEATEVHEETLRRLLNRMNETCEPWIADRIRWAADALPDPEGRFVEDVEWMAQAGESIDGCAARLGLSRDSLVRQLAADRHNRPDLLHALTMNGTGFVSDASPVGMAGNVGAAAEPVVDAGTARAAASRVAGAAVRTAVDPAAALVEVLDALGLSRGLRQGTGS